MDKFQTYFGQVVTETELNAIFAELVNGIERFIQDFGYVGIAVGGEVTRHHPAALSVDVSAPTIIYDQQGNRVSFATPQVVNCSVDENNSSTVVIGPGNEKWLSVFAKFVSIPTDPREDELGNEVFFRNIGSYQLRVAQGAEAGTGTANRVALRGDQILLADVLLEKDQVTILDEHISLDRVQVIYQLTGSPLAIQARNLQDVVQQMLEAINANKAELDGDISTLATAIADVDAITAIGGSPNNITLTNVQGAIAQLLSLVNALYPIVTKLRLSSTSSGDLEYVTPQPRERIIGPHEGYSGNESGEKRWVNVDDDAQYIHSNGSNNIPVRFPLVLPRGARITRIRVSIDQSVAESICGAALKVLNPYHFTIGPHDYPVATTLAGNSSAAVSGGQIFALLPEPLDVTVEAGAYIIEVRAGDSASGHTIKLYGIQVLYEDPGTPGNR